MPTAAQPQSVGELLLNSAEKNPERVFLRHVNGTTLTYADGVIRAAEIALDLQEHGLKRGDRVVCYLENILESALFDLGAFTAGVVPVPLSPIFSTKFMDGLVERTQAKAVFTLASLADVFQERGIVPLCFQDVRQPRDERINPLAIHTGLTFQDACAIMRKQLAPTTPQTLCLIQPTSGSSGTPKLVLRRHAGPLRYARWIGEQLGPGEDGPHRFLHVAALTHAFGCHMLATAMSLGAEVCLTTAIDANASLTEVLQINPSVLPVLPRVLRSMNLQRVAKLPPERREEPTRLFGDKAKYVLSAGGRADAKAMSALRAQGLEVLEFYGSSEASIVALTPKGEWRAGFAGRVVPDVELRVDPSGELLIKSPGLMEGYLEGDRVSAEVINEEGFYRSGDFGKVVEDRWLKVEGRKTDTFNTPEGSNIFPDRLEQAVERLAWVNQAILVGDQKPFFSVFAVLSDTALQRFNIKPESLGEDGLLDALQYEQVYEELTLDIERENATLERIERLTALMLFARPFPATVYQTVAAGKVRRNRSVFDVQYGSRIAQLYGVGALDANSPMLVPPRERRLRARIPGYEPNRFLKSASKPPEEG